VKVVLCLNHFLPTRRAGTEVYVFSLAKELEKFGVICKVIIPNFNCEKNDYYTFDGIEVVKYAEPSRIDKLLISGKKKPEGIAEFIKIIENEKPNLIHFHELLGSNNISLHHLKAVKEKGYKTLVTFHLSGYSCFTGNLLYKEKEPCNGEIDIQKCSKCYLHTKKLNPHTEQFLATLNNILFYLNIKTMDTKSSFTTALSINFLIKEFQVKLNKIVEYSDGIISLTNWYSSVLKLNKVPSEKINYIPQALPKQKDILVEGSTKKGNELKVVFVGRISPIKGIHLLIEAMKDLPHKLISLDIFGEPQDIKYFENCINLTKSMSNIRWRGVVESEMVVHELKNYDLLCLPSTTCEMAPLVIQEAFAAGLPVLASNVQGNAEQIVSGVNGWLFNYNDSSSLEAILQDIIEFPEELEVIKKNISMPLPFEEVAKEHNRLYNKILLIQ